MSRTARRKDVQSGAAKLTGDETLVMSIAEFEQAVADGARERAAPRAGNDPAPEPTAEATGADDGERPDDDGDRLDDDGDRLDDGVGVDWENHVPAAGDGLPQLGAPGRAFAYVNRIRRKRDVVELASRAYETFRNLCELGVLARRARDLVDELESSGRIQPRHDELDVTIPLGASIISSHETHDLCEILERLVVLLESTVETLRWDGEE